jgi:hypothetical protein
MDISLSDSSLPTEARETMEDQANNIKVRKKILSNIQKARREKKG